ncbi:MAG: zinc ribbon domain-containing protein [Sporomusaceae bacterium]|nr:zinc ribbon domain-containing protein [Sporomusaceae bacterium]
MNCVHCGTVLPDDAQFCLQCGTAQPPAGAAVPPEAGTIQFRQIAEKWSLFGKEICRFEAVVAGGGVIAVSDSFTMSGFEYYGPNERNRKHKAAFDGLVKNLLAAGWRLGDPAGPEWFSVRLLRP